MLIFESFNSDTAQYALSILFMQQTNISNALAKVEWYRKK